MSTVVANLMQEWSVPVMGVVRLVLSCFCGFLIGYERQERIRQRHMRGAGLRTHMLVALAAAALMAAACDFTDSDRQIEDLKKELKELKESNSALRQSYIDQNEDISRILEEIVTVTGRTASLRSDVESGSAEIAQAEQISESIRQIRRRIDELESAYSQVSAKNKEFKRMIDGFKKVISEQEDQIQLLKDEIKAKDLTIAEQEVTIQKHEVTISAQDETIRRQNEELQATVAKQARMLYEAGMQLEEIADNAPEVSWKKNKEKVDVMTQDIYRKARLYYQQAYEAGYEPALAAISAIQAKIQAE